MTSAPHASSARATSSARRAVRRAPSAPIVICAMTGIVGVDLARGANRLLDLVEIAERLEDEEIGAAVVSAVHLLAEHRARLVAARRPYGSRRTPSGPTAPATSTSSPAASRAIFAAARLSSRDLRLEPVLRELEPVRAEAVRLEHLRAGLHVRAWTSRTRSGARTFSSS